MPEKHRIFCPPPVNVSLQDRLLPFVNDNLPFLSAGMPPFGGSQQFVIEVGATFIRVEDVDGTVRRFDFFERPVVLFTTGVIEPPPPAIGLVHVTIADAELNEIFELDVDLLEIGRDYIEVFVTFRRALIPINRFLQFECVEESPEE